MHRIRRIAIPSLIFIGALAGLMSLGTLPASAQVLEATQANHLAIPQSGGVPHCSGDVCAKWLSKTSFKVRIEVWAFKKNFTGHFELKTPAGAHFDSTSKAWVAGGAGYDVTVALSSGKYEAIAWKNVSSGKYRNIGDVTFTV